MSSEKDEQEMASEYDFTDAQRVQGKYADRIDANPPSLLQRLAGLRAHLNKQGRGFDIETVDAAVAALLFREERDEPENLARLIEETGATIFRMLGEMSATLRAPAGRDKFGAFVGKYSRVHFTIGNQTFDLYGGADIDPDIDPEENERSLFWTRRQLEVALVRLAGRDPSPVAELANNYLARDLSDEQVAEIDRKFLAELDATAADMGG